VKFLVDAQLPRRAVGWLAAAGCDAVHTLDLPNGNRTTDVEIIDTADREQRVVVTKDADFVDSHIPSRCPGIDSTSRGCELRRRGIGPWHSAVRGMVCEGSHGRATGFAHQSLVRP
jgi:hypothetical protein